MYYILKNKEVIKVDSVLEWAKNFENIENFEKNKIVARTEIGKIAISTIFLWIDHNFIQDGKPLLFETMVFGGPSEYQARYSTYEEAEAGHKEVCEVFEKRIERLKNK